MNKTRNRSKDIAWKVVRTSNAGIMTSAFNFHGYPLLYSKLHPTNAPGYGRPLFCFNTRKNARAFLRGLRGDGASNFRLVKVHFMQGTPPQFKIQPPPLGTIYASQVQLID